MIFGQMQALSCAVILSLVVADSVRAEMVSFGSGVNAFTMDFVPIGNLNNPDDTTGSPNPAGKVEYEYQIAKYEISRDMITKANTVGSIGITMADMTPFGGNGVNRPATGVSWNEAARFVNWLNTSQGFQAAYNFVSIGVNDDVALWHSSDAWQLGGENLFRHKDAKYWLPSMDEWFKAAFYDPSKGSYLYYPTGSDSSPTPVANGTSAHTAVYLQYTSQGPADITQAGGLSPYGVVGLGGNVYEWEETAFDLVNDNSRDRRGLRGGSWNSSSDALVSSDRFNNYSAGESYESGFRVASLSSAAAPEPTSLLLCGVGFGSLIVNRRVRR